MKRLLLLLALLLPLGAQAAPDSPWRFELLPGTCEKSHLPPGGWWHPHYPVYSIDMTTECYQLSASKLTSKWRSFDLGWRFGYVDMGSASISAVWWMRDEDLGHFPDGSACNPSTMQDCLGVGFIKQKVRGFSFGGLMEREVGAVRFGLEGGLYLYSGSFDFEVRDSYPNSGEFASHKGHFQGEQASLYVGLSASYGPLMVLVRQYGNIKSNEHGCGGCSGPTNGRATQVSIGLTHSF